MHIIYAFKVYLQYLLKEFSYCHAYVFFFFLSGNGRMCLEGIENPTVGFKDKSGLFGNIGECLGNHFRGYRPLFMYL